MNIVLTGGKVTTLCSVFTRVTLSLYLKQLWLPLELFVLCLRLLFLLCSSACLSVYLSLSLCLSLWMCVSVMWVWRSSHSDGYLIAVEPPHLLQASHLQPINSSTLQNINPGLSATHCLAVVQVGLLGHRLFKLWFQVTPCVFIHLLLCFFCATASLLACLAVHCPVYSSAIQLARSWFPRIPLCSAMLHQQPVSLCLHLLNIPLTHLHSLNSANKPVLNHSCCVWDSHLGLPFADC